MDRSFRLLLTSKNVKPATVAILEQEDITSESVFYSLKDEDFKLLVDRGITIGQIAMLRQAHIRDGKDQPKKSTSRISNGK